MVEDSGIFLFLRLALRTQPRSFARFSAAVSRGVRVLAALSLATGLGLQAAETPAAG
jgi:hypothetical protein